MRLRGGGYVGAVVTPTLGAAPGVWSMADVLAARKVGAWPTSAAPEPETLALVARFSTPPSDTRKATIDAFWKTPGIKPIMAKMDGFYVLAAADAQAARQNWVEDRYNLTAVAGPAFTADRGYTGDNSAAYLDTAYNPATAVTPKLVRDSAHIGAWNLSDTLSGTVYDIGSSTQMRMTARSTSADTMRGQVNSAAIANYGAIASSMGHAVLSRVDSAQQIGYRDGVKVATVAATSAVPASGSMTLLAAGGTLFSNRQMAVGHFGAGLSESEITTLYGAIRTYLQAIGAVA